MSRLHHRSLALAVASLCLLPSVASATITGLFIKDQGSVVAAVLDGVVIGELSTRPGQIGNELTISFIDDVLGEIQPASPPHSVSAVIANPLVASYGATGAYTFQITAGDPGSTTIAFTLLDNGNPVYTSLDIPCHSEEAHVEADGFILRDGTGDLVHVWRGVVTGQLQVTEGGSRGPITVVFLSPDSIEFTPNEPDFVLRLDLADSSSVRWRSIDQWTFDIVGHQFGTTTFTLNVHHIDHDDFVSPAMTAATVYPLGVAPRVEANGVSLSAPSPNPVRGRTTLRFSLATAQDVELGVFDVAGRAIGTIASARFAPGLHALDWDPGELGPGLYLVRLRTSTATVTQRVLRTR
ncbi:MAG: T9SS type A sorting domain-containing protein [Planctomycetota bacterium]